jgi:hypothetical protein
MTSLIINDMNGTSIVMFVYSSSCITGRFYIKIKFIFVEIELTAIFELAKEFSWMVGWIGPVPPLYHPSSLSAGAHYLTCRRIN